jgi:N12 class adenine-specific DNA methylase
VDAIKNSKLPDEIKRLMMEHPISQPQQQVTTISDELVEKATRLMKKNDGNYIPESAKPKQSQQQVQQPTGGIDYKLIQKMINEAVSNALKENGLLIESSEKSNELFTFRVGKHVFEGKVSKIKKMS